MNAGMPLWISYTASSIAMYAVVWIVIFFMTLPLGVSIPEQQEKGHASSAPQVANIGKKMLWTTGVSLIVFGLLVYLRMQGIFDDFFSF